MISGLARRFQARNWRCRCGKHVFADPDGCHWHARVRERVLAGMPSKLVSSRRSPWQRKRP